MPVPSRPATTTARACNIRATTCPDSGSRLIVLAQIRVHNAPGVSPQTSPGVERGDRVGECVLPWATAKCSPCPSWSILDLRMWSRRPAGLCSTSVRASATISERRIAEA